MNDQTRAEEESVALEVAEGGATGSRSLLGAALLGSGATLLVGLLGVLRTKVLAVGLEPSGLGLYGQILTMLTALSAASGLGLGLGTTRLVAASRARKDSRQLKEALEVSFALPLAVGTLIALALAATSGLLAPLLLDDDRPLLIVLASLAIPTVALQGPFVHALQGFRDVAGAQSSNVFFGVVLTLASVAGVVAAGLDGAVVALALGNLLYAVALGWRLRVLVRGAGVTLAARAGLRRGRLRNPAIRGMLLIGFASMFVGVASALAELAVRTFVLRTDGADAAGIFQALQLISLQLLGVIVASVVFLSFTAISEAHAVGDHDRVRRSLDDTLRLGLLLVLPVLLVLALFRREIIPLLLSSGFDEAADLLPRQLTGDALRTLAWVLGAALVPVGLTRMWVLVTVLSVAAYVGAAALLVPAHGLDGAVDAYVIEWAVAAALSVAVLARSGLFRPGGLTWRTLVLGAGIVIVVATASPSAPVGVLIVAVSAALLLALGTGREERAALAARARELLGA